MLSQDQIREQLKDRKLTAVATATGLHYHTVRRVAKENGFHDYDTLRRLSDYLTAGGRSNG